MVSFLKFSKALLEVTSLPQVQARAMALPQHPSEPPDKPPAMGDRSPCSHPLVLTLMTHGSTCRILECCPLVRPKGPPSSPSIAGEVGRGGPKVAVPVAAGRAASVWSVAIWMYLQQYCSNCEKIKNLQANLDSHCIFCIFEDSSLKPDSREGRCLHSLGAFSTALPDSKE